MKSVKQYSFLLLAGVFLFIGCEKNPLTGKHTMAFVDNSSLFPTAFRFYDEFISENKVISKSPEAAMVERAGNNIMKAAEKWLAAEGYGDYLSEYQWEFTLIESEEVNAWALPGGKIVFYTGIMPVAMNEEGIATVMGHEIAHALLNHAQQRQSAGILRTLGAIAISFFISDESAVSRELAMIAYDMGSQVLGTLPFSRKHEKEADHYGLILMAIAGYNPEEAAPLWDRMSGLGGGGMPVFLSTHPMSADRAKNLRKLAPEAKSKAREFGVEF